ncbi:MAG: hypothetical protein QM642_07560 [Edaphocola sp.]
MASVKFYKALALPGTPEANAFYMVKGTADTAFRFYLTNTSGAAVEIDAVTAATLATGLAGKEDSIAGGSTTQYWRGDKTWQTLDKTAVGLANVDNTSDTNKPISTATQLALDTKINTSEKGAVNGVATLGSDGKIPSTQLPSYVDDILEYATSSAFPATGETGVIYVAQDTNYIYRWSGSAYIQITSGDVTALGNFFVRYDTTQTLTTLQKTNARANINAAAADEVVGLTGDQAVAGIKTFSSAPRATVDASAGNDLVRFSQVAGLVAAATLAWGATDW